MLTGRKRGEESEGNLWLKGTVKGSKERKSLEKDNKKITEKVREASF